MRRHLTHEKPDGQPAATHTGRHFLRPFTPRIEKFAFSIMDADGSGSVDRAEIASLVKMVFGKKNIDDKVDRLLKKIDADGSGTITYQEFQAMQKSCNSLLKPVFELQRALSSKCCGAAYWAKATASRKKMKDQGDLIKLHARLYNIQQVKVAPPKEKKSE
jgi:hypothetical protein